MRVVSSVLKDSVNADCEWDICNSSLVYQSKKHHLVIREGSGRFDKATAFILDTVDTAGNGMFLEIYFAS